MRTWYVVCVSLCVRACVCARAHVYVRVCVCARADVCGAVGHSRQWTLYRDPKTKWPFVCAFNSLFQEKSSSCGCVLKRGSQVSSEGVCVCVCVCV